MTLFFAKFSENFFALPYRSNPCVDQGIDHSGHCFSNLKGVFPGKIDFSGMRMFVLSVPIHNSFKADSQKGTCRTRGKTNDGLSFVKNFFGVLRHIFRRSYSAANGVLNLSVFPENQLSATAALCNENSFGMKEVKHTIVSSVFQSVTMTLVKIIQRRCFPSFGVRANN